MSADIRSVSELQAARQQVIQAEQDRLEAETANQREIAALDEQIAEAAEHEARAAFEQTLPEAKRLADVLNTANIAVKQAIQQRNLPAAMDAYSAAVNAWKALEAHNLQALQHIAPLANAVFNANLNDAYGQNLPLARQAWRQEYSHYVYMLAWNVRPIEYVTEIVASGGQIECGLALAITGYHLLPDKNYQAAQATQAMVAQITGLNRM